MNTPGADEYSENFQPDEGPVNKSRLVGVSLFVTEIGSMIAYGITGQYYQESAPEPAYT